MENKFLRRLSICINVLDINLESQINSWKKEVENGGYFPENLKNILDKSMEIVKKLMNRYKDVQYTNEDVNKVYKECLYLIKIHNNQLKKKGVAGFDYEFEKKELPAGFLDSFISISTALSYLDEKLKITLEREKIKEDIEQLNKELEVYGRFVEEELILNTI